MKSSVDTWDNTKGAIIGRRTNSGAGASTQRHTWIFHEEYSKVVGFLLGRAFQSDV
jgi:hypothetical protein